MGDDRKLRHSLVQGTSRQTPERRARKAFLRTRARGTQPSYPGSRKPGVPAGHLHPLNSSFPACPPPRFSPRLPQSILLLGCRSRPGHGSPCPAGGRTQTRSPARGSPGERGAGSILPGKRRARVRAGGGEQPPCGAQTRLLPRPPPRASPAAHLPLSVPSPSSPAPSPARALCSPPERAPSQSSAESPRRRRRGRANKRASGGAAARGRASPAPSLAPHPGSGDRSERRAWGPRPAVRRRGWRGYAGSRPRSKAAAAAPSRTPLILQRLNLAKPLRTQVDRAKSQAEAMRASCPEPLGRRGRPIPASQAGSSPPFIGFSQAKLTCTCHYFNQL